MTAEPQPDAAAPVRLILVDDHEMVIEGLKAILARQRRKEAEP